MTEYRVIYPECEEKSIRVTAYTVIIELTTLHLSSTQTLRNAMESLDTGGNAGQKNRATS